jgi:hypothetical protein
MRRDMAARFEAERIKASLSKERVFRKWGNKLAFFWLNWESHGVVALKSRARKISSI